jgi:hypothetical protein
MRRGHVPRGERVHELRPGDGLNMRSAKLDELHPHRVELNSAPTGILHPCVGDQDPERRQVRAQRDEERDHQVLDLAEAVPAEEEQADERRFQEERHQSFERQRRPKMSPT